jgi:hypothetical protein
MVLVPQHRRVDLAIAKSGADASPEPHVHSLSRCSVSRLATAIVLVSCTAPFSRDRTRQRALPSLLPSHSRP